MNRVIPSLVIALVALTVAVPVEASALTRQRAERALKREVRDRYPDVSQERVEVSCRRLTASRFKCRYIAHSSAFDEGYYGYCGHQGIGYVRKYASGAVDATASRPREKPENASGGCSHL